MKSLFVTATDTGVGKTLVSTLLVQGLLARGLPAFHFKPVQTGTVEIDGRAYPPDPAFSSGIIEPETPIASYCAKRTLYHFEPPIAPDHAAELAGVSMSKQRILEAVAALETNFLPVVEGAGGAAVPVYGSYLFADLVAEAARPVIVVARSTLGTINHTLITIDYLKHKGISVAGVVISGYDKANVFETRNIARIQALAQIPLWGIVPKISGLDTEAVCSLSSKEAATIGADAFNWEMILKYLTHG